MIRTTLVFVFLCVILSCSKIENKLIINEDLISDELVSKKDHLINEQGKTIKTRFLPPTDYYWIESNSGSFASYIENFPLKPFDSPILKYDGTPITTQYLHKAVFDLDVGEKDLQQCADAVIRLRAEYLYQTKQFDKLKFHFTNGDQLSWNDYKSGIRCVVNGNKVKFKKIAEEDNSKQNFRRYLDLIFNYAGTISLANYETEPILNNSELKTGDILITAGSPGHVVFISGVIENNSGERLYLLGQGFTPAQSVHILSNPYQPELSPWYLLDVNASQTKTARYVFKPNNFRRFNF